MRRFAGRVVLRLCGGFLIAVDRRSGEDVRPLLRTGRLSLLSN